MSVEDDDIDRDLHLDRYILLRQHEDALKRTAAPLAPQTRGLLEEMKQLGNRLFTEGDAPQALVLYYGAASLLEVGVQYITGSQQLQELRFTALHLAPLMADEDMRMCAILFLNRAQALLKLPQDALDPTLAAITATSACEAALHVQSVHSARTLLRQYLGQPHASIDGAERQRAIKAVARLAAAQERALNLNGALRRYRWLAASADAQGVLEGGQTMEQKSESLWAIAAAFASGDVVTPLPRGYRALLQQASPGLHHHAKASPLHPPLDMEALSFDRIFCAGQHKGAGMFVARRAGAGGSPRHYMLNVSMEGLRASEKTSRPYKMHGFDAGGVTHEDKLCLVSLGAAKCGFLLTSLAQGKEGSTGLYTHEPAYGTFPEGTARHGASVAQCGGALYIFGGVDLRRPPPAGRLPRTDTSMKAWDNMIRVKPGPRSDYGTTATIFPACAVMPSRRHGHASWAYDGKVYIFGGISLARYPELGTTEVLHERVLSDLWCFDPAREAWTQLEPAGSRPCARALMGVASHEHRAVIVGGVGNLQEGRQQLLLADAFEFDAKRVCWVQVLPHPGEREWLSARHSPACSYMEGDRYVVLLGGYGRNGAPLNGKGLACTLLEMVRSNAAAKAISTVYEKVEPPDGAIIKVCEAAAQIKAGAIQEAFAQSALHLPSVAMELLSRACTYASQHPDVLLTRAPRWGEPAEPLFALLGPSRKAECPFSSKPDVDALGAERSCFSLAPRWLGPPNEMVCTLAARADVPWDPDNILVAHMTSTAKCFSTAWGATTYFRTVRPSATAMVSDWQLCGLDHHFGTKTSFNELLVFTAAFIGDGVIAGVPANNRQMMQVFIIAVEGNWFAGLLARLQVPRGKEPWHWNTAFEKLIRMLHSTLHPKGDPKELVVDCNYCGRAECLPLRKNGRPCAAKIVKVCGGCGLVRYCAGCQAKAWPVHRKECKEHRKKRRVDGAFYDMHYAQMHPRVPPPS